MSLPLEPFFFAVSYEIVKIHTLLFLLCFSSFPLFSQTPSPIGKVVDAYLEGTTTYMLIEARRMLNTFQTVYLHGGIPITVKEVMSVRETEGVYYYRGFTPEKVRVLPGENVFFEITKKEAKLKRFERETIFMKKKYATVTFVEGKKAMINRGSLHNVDKRDIYRVYNQNKNPKGEVELYGIGDFLSVGSLRYPIEQGGKQIEAKEGDTAVFAGNRKVVGMAPFLVIPMRENSETHSKGGGVLWSFILRRGKIFEFLAGNQQRIILIKNNEVTSYFDSPIWFRKAFFYPGMISPSLSIGVAYFRHYNQSQKIKTTLAPAAGATLEFFTGRTVHLRFDIQYYYASPKEYLGQKYRSDSLFFMGGLSLNW